jgi:CheY-like chemotaxis protein
MATILIVDDDRALREGLAETIAGLGHRPLSAASGPEALARLQRESVDAVLLDLHLPDMDGIEVLRRLRENPKRPPVVILTAFASAANTIEAMRLVLTKASRKRWSAPARRCGAFRRRSALPPTATQRCWCWARPARGRSWSRERCTTTGGATQSHSSL